MILKRVIQKLAVRTFGVWERLGLHVLPAHYYYPVPSSDDLPDRIFETVSETVGVDWKRDDQRRYLREVFPKYLQEVSLQPNAGLALVDAAVLHAMVRHHKPRRIIEIGSGHSTKITAAAAVRNREEGVESTFTAIEPYPPDFLKAPIDGLTELRAQKIQDVPLPVFADCDLLFVDSSHVVSMGGDVTWVQLEILPRLKKGCLIHFHDILLPAHYWKDWVRTQRFYWTEQYLLQAFLMFNQEFSVVWAARLMQIEAERELAAVFPFHTGGDPDQRVSSLWIRRNSA